jgi:hypothetical protein
VRSRGQRTASHVDKGRQVTKRGLIEPFLDQSNGGADHLHEIAEIVHNSCGHETRSGKPDHVAFLASAMRTVNQFKLIAHVDPTHL